MNVNLPLVMDTIIQVRKYEHKIAQLEAEIEQLKLHLCNNCDLPAFKTCKVCSECGVYTIIESDGPHLSLTADVLCYDCGYHFLVMTLNKS